jgi:hypothetical protein
VAYARHVRTLSRTLTVSIAALVLPATANAGVIEVSTDLAKRKLHPAPLMPTTAPRSLSPLNLTIDRAPTRRRSAYAISMRSAFRSDQIDSVLFLEGGEFKSMRAVFHDFRGTPRRGTRVRGRRAYLFSAHGLRSLIWSEGGRIYEMGSGTPRTVSLKEMRATADGLDPLVGGFSGSFDSSSETGAFSSNEAFVAATRRTFSADIDWTANCTTPDGRPGTQRAGRALATLQPLRSAAFSYDVGPFVINSEIPWQGTVTGAINASGGTIGWRVTTVAEGENCDSGPVSITLTPGDGSR